MEDAMRLLFVAVLWCFTSVTAWAEKPPTLPPGLHLSQPPFTRFDSRIRGIKLRCVQYEEIVGDVLHFWEVCRLANDRRILTITMWPQFGDHMLDWESEIFFPKDRTDL
ncbi:MAG: hypothetical protein MUF19_01805 [Candidatus Pacebacteria bacterium]|jgi:hypothetical protein|nr:hypothetical protein [Candidatus Paceibacterota bacterium]